MTIGIVLLQAPRGAVFLVSVDLLCKTVNVGTWLAKSLVVCGGVLRELKMLKGHLPRVIYHQVYWYRKINRSG